MQVDLDLQWNPSNPDTIGPEESVLIREVSLFQGLKSTHTWYLGKKKVSCLERCPYFRGVLIEGFHCIQTSVQDITLTEIKPGDNSETVICLTLGLYSTV